MFILALLNIKDIIVSENWKSLLSLELLLLICIKYQLKLAVKRRDIHMQFMDNLGRKDESRIIDTDFNENWRVLFEFIELVHHAEFEVQVVERESRHWLRIVD